MHIRNFSPWLIALAALLSACTGMFESGSDHRADWNLAPVTAANSDADDLAPVPSSRGLYFTSNREVDDTELDRLYLLPYDATAGRGVRGVRGSAADIKAGAVAFVPGSESAVLYVECYRDDGIGDCDLIEGRFSADGLAIERTKVMQGPLNDVEWDHHPALSGDGKTLVFASERFGGIGGSDLWMSRLGSGGWSAPVNLGEEVNTAGNEITPFLSPEGSTLYFSSDGLPGMGGFDIYASTMQDGKWSAPKPIGRPFNSGDDDIFFHGDITADTVYFSSNRGGGTGGFDIWRAARKVVPPPPPPPPPVPKEKSLVLRVQAKNAFTMQNIPAAVDIISTSDERLLSEGRGTAEARLDLRKWYTAKGQYAGYEEKVASLRFDDAGKVTRMAKDEGERVVITHDLLMIPVLESERKIYAFTVEFDFNLFNIRPEEERKLDSAVVLLTKYPQSTVVFSGHTDSMGTVNYNIKLGYNRAKEVSSYVQDWLFQKGVKLRNEVEIRTYGEGEPIAPNSTDEGRQRNRRVEIAIVRNQ